MPGLKGMGQYLRFALGQARYAVGLDRVKEILEFGALTPVPLMPDCVRGVMNLRGAVVPVIDLGSRLGLGSARISRRTCIVMVDLGHAEGGGSPPMGMLVDAVDEVFAAGDAEHEAVPPLGTPVEPRYLRSLVRLRGETTPELDLPAVLDPAMLARA
jgi:purine-binding chemotaxis protein CheW